MRTTTLDEVERLAERIYNQYGPTISDRDSFDLAFDNYMGEVTGSQDTSLRSQVFDVIASTYPHKVSREREFKKAGGKDLKRDRLQTAKTVVTDKKEYRRRGARRVDLKGYDTRLSSVGKIKGRVVYVRKQYVLIKGHRIVRYRARNGRFASVIS